MLEDDLARDDDFTQKLATDRSPRTEDFAEPLSIQRFPERHAFYAVAIESFNKKTGRDFRRVGLEHLVSCCHPARLRLCERKLLT